MSLGLQRPQAHPTRSYPQAAQTQELYRALSPSRETPPGGSFFGFNSLWTACGLRSSPTADTAQSGPQRPIQACFDMTVPISLIRLVMLLRRLRVPQVDVQTLDLFDQQENRLSGRAKLLIAAVNKTRAPGAELFDLALFQTIAQRSAHQGLGQCTTV